MKKVTFGQKLEKLRTKKGISLQQLAKALNLHLSLLYKYLNGECLPSVENAVKIADYFRRPLHFVFGVRRGEKERVTFETFAERFAYALQKRGVSRYKFVKETGLSKESVDKWAKGQRQPSTEGLIIAAKYLNCSIDFLAGRELKNNLSVEWI